MNFSSRLIFALALTASPLAAQGLEMLSEVAERLGGADIDAKKGVTFDKNAGSLVWDGGIHLKSEAMEIFAERAEYVVEQENLVITGDVSVYKDGMVYRGEKAIYSSKTNQLDASGMRSSLEPRAPLWFKSSSFNSETSGDVEVINSSGMEITTEDSSDPGFHLSAKEVKIYPEDRIVFKNLKAYIGDVPVFWLPYLAQPLDEEQGYTFTPGYRSNMGGFLLNQFGDTIGDHSIIKYKLDGYSARGIGTGVEIHSRKFKEMAQGQNFGKFNFYWINDTNPLEGGLATNQDRTGVDANRYRVNLQHRVYLPGPEASDLYIDLDLNKISDEFFYEDFFPWEFREDPQPDNVINIVKTHERGELSLLTRLQLNDFYSTDTRLPEIALDAVKQPIGQTGLFYGSNTSFGILEDHLGSGDKAALEKRIDQIEALLAADAAGLPLEEALTKEGKKVNIDNVGNGILKPGEKFKLSQADDVLSQLRSQANESKFNRFHTYHELSYPTVVGGGVTLTPRVGVGFTNYSSVSGPQPLNTSRAIMAAGLEASTKFSRTYDDVVVPSLGLNGVRHVVQPYLNWSYVNADDQGTQFGGIDRLVRSTEPRSLDVNNFTAVDSLNNWNIVRAGVTNRFQTKRNGGSFNWLQTNTYVDAYIEDPEFDRSLSNLYNEITFEPLSWMRLNIDSQVPIGGGDNSFSQLNTRVRFMPRKDLEFTIGHRFLKDHPYFENSSLIDLGTYYRINDNWGISAYERFEADDSTLEMQQYSIHRDLASWAMSLGAVIRDNRGETEYGMVFSLTLKEFPGVRIPIDYDPTGGNR
jgi:LPS-assembly protein